MHFVSSNQQTPKYFMNYMPQFYKIINNFKIDDISEEIKFSLKIYFLKNKIISIPKCNLHNCENKCELLKSPGFGFTLYCKEHKHVMFSSKKELEVYNWIKTVYLGEVIKNYRNFYNNELDIFLPELNLGIEFNGLYWHSENFKNKNSHYEKFYFS